MLVPRAFIATHSRRGLDVSNEPRLSLVAPADCASPANNLVPLTAHLWSGVVLFSLRTEALPPVLPPLDLPHYAGALSAESGCNWKIYLGHVVRRWPEAVVVEHIMPRTFMRTRVVSHVLGGDVQGIRDFTQQTAMACERLQAERATTIAAPPGTPLVMELHRRVLAAYSAC